MSCHIMSLFRSWLCLVSLLNCLPVIYFCLPLLSCPSHSIHRPFVNFCLLFVSLVFFVVILASLFVFLLLYVLVVVSNYDCYPNCVCVWYSSSLPSLSASQLIWLFCQTACFCLPSSPIFVNSNSQRWYNGKIHPHITHKHTPSISSIWHTNSVNNKLISSSLFVENCRK